MAEAAILSDTGARRHHHLDEAHLADVLGVALQQAAERQEAARNSLGIVEAVDASYEPHALGGPEQFRLAADPRRNSALGEVAGVDADGECADPHLAALVLQRAIGLDGRRQAQRGMAKVRGVSAGMEADQVGAQHSFEHLAAAREDAEDLAGRERSVEEEPNAGRRQPATKQRRNQQELVVVHPDVIALAPDFRRGVGELLVDLFVNLPTGRLQRQPVGEVVEQGPEQAIGHSLVVFRHLAGAERHRDAVQLLQSLVELGALGARNSRHRSGPAHPECVRASAHRLQCRGQSPDAPVHFQLARFDTGRDGQPVGYQDGARRAHVQARTRPSRTSRNSLIVIAA